MADRKFGFDTLCLHALIGHEILAVQMLEPSAR